MRFWPTLLLHQNQNSRPPLRTLRPITRSMLFALLLLTTSSFTLSVNAQTVRTLPGKDSIGHIEVHPSHSIISFTHIQRLTPVNQLSSQVVAEYIPTNIETGASGDQVFRKILDRSLRTVFNRDPFKRSKVVRTAKLLGEKVETDFSFSTSASSDSPAIKHSVKMQMRAFQSMAIVRYQGLFDADLIYDLGNQAGEFTVTQHLTELSDLSLRLRRDDGISTSTITYRLSY